MQLDVKKLLTKRKRMSSYMVYKCENKECGFIFSRQGEVTQCPNCGKSNIRIATPEEEETFYKLLEEDKK